MELTRDEEQKLIEEIERDEQEERDEFVRVQALHAATRLEAVQMTHRLPGSMPSHKNIAALVERFEHYIRTGKWPA